MTSPSHNVTRRLGYPVISDHSSASIALDALKIRARANLWARRGQPKHPATWCPPRIALVFFFFFLKKRPQFAPNLHAPRSSLAFAPRRGRGKELAPAPPESYRTPAVKVDQQQALNATRAVVVTLGQLGGISDRKGLLAQPQRRS